MKLIAWLHKDPSRNMTSMYLVKDCPDENCGYALHFKKDRLQETKLTAGMSTPPLMEVSGVLKGFTESFLQAMVDLGAEEGIFPEASHRDRIKAESIAEERLDVISHERNQFNSLLNKIINEVRSQQIMPTLEVKSDE